VASRRVRIAGAHRESHRTPHLRRRHPPAVVHGCEPPVMRWWIGSCDVGAMKPVAGRIGPGQKLFAAAAAVRAYVSPLPTPRLRPLCEAVEMDDAIARYQAASVANDIEAVIATLVRAAELVSPMSGHMVFLGQADLQVPFDAIYGFPRDLRWTEEIRGGSVRVVVGEARIGPVRLTDRGVLD